MHSLALLSRLNAIGRDSPVDAGDFGHEFKNRGLLKKYLS